MQNFKNLYICIGMMAGLLLGSHSSLWAQTNCAKPSSLLIQKMEGGGNLVHVSWTAPYLGNLLYAEDFETADEKLSDWVRIITDSFAYEDYHYSWFLYNHEREGNIAPASGNQSIAVYMDELEPQNEWIISKPLPYAALFEFSNWLPREIVEAGQYEDFPDHYCFKVSYDSLKSWQTLWDGRYSNQGTNEWERVCLSSERLSPHTFLAFQAYGDTISGLHANWFIDDVKVYDSAQNPIPDILASNPLPTQIKSSKHLNFRTFQNSGNLEISQSKNTKSLPASSYHIYLDGKLYAENLSAYTIQINDLTKGDHQIGVSAYYKNALCESAQITKNVSITEEDFDCAPPKNLVIGDLSYNEDPMFQCWVGTLSWESAGKRKPTSYSIYQNGDLSALQYDGGQEWELAFLLENTLYTANVQAEYSYPECKSAFAKIPVAVGPNIGLPPLNLEAKSDGAKGFLLQWKAPLGSKEAPIQYIVYRNGVKLGETIDLTYTDAQASMGEIAYGVCAKYPNKLSPLTVTSLKNGESKAIEMPYEQNFNGFMIPEQWTAIDLTGEKNEVITPAWLFNNLGKRMIDGKGFDDNFAIVDDAYYGMNCIINEVLNSPIFNCKDATQPKLSFAYFYPSLGVTTARIEYRTDGGTWNTLQKLDSSLVSRETPVEAVKVKEVVLDMSSFLKGKSTFQFRFVYEGFSDISFAVDAIKLTKEGGSKEALAQANNYVRVSPNPVSNGSLSIVSNSKIHEIRMYNLSGTEILKRSAQQESLQLNIEGLPSGLYFIKVFTENGILQTKVVVTQ